MDGVVTIIFTAVSWTCLCAYVGYIFGMYRSNKRYITNLRRCNATTEKYAAEHERLSELNQSLFESLIDVARNEATVEIGKDGNVICKRTRDRAASLH